ncbi:hypothetical protein [Candidatus Allofournierella merdipullorum]|uniref:hypothetical protein n=1 Tax=Candidatus Allofournierella merdipullorum TaxID=2838595 RepID=UPI00374E79B8
MDKKEQATKVARDVLDLVNSYGCDEEAFAKTICQGHKTLQQSTMRLFMTTIRHMAQTCPDARNEATVKLAQEITVLADKCSLPLI